ncbi:MAG: hypothetical protein CMJ90_11000 [Planctomycetes bacterium]|nr:hypothetical protein [Planctomycetota bacterium]
MRIITVAFVGAALLVLGACGAEEASNSPESTKAPAENTDAPAATDAEWQTVTVFVEGMT